MKTIFIQLLVHLQKFKAWSLQDTASLQSVKSQNLHH